jgi:hypothetical protein
LSFLLPPVSELLTVGELLTAPEPPAVPVFAFAPQPAPVTPITPTVAVTASGRSLLLIVAP